MNETERGWVPPTTDKEIVIYRGGWGFRVPDQHSVKVNEEVREVDLSIPDRGGSYAYDRIEETDEEYRIYVRGSPLRSHALRDLPGEYPFPNA